jgi:hypothetical protein
MLSTKFQNFHTNFIYCIIGMSKKVVFAILANQLLFQKYNNESIFLYSTHVYS